MGGSPPPCVHAGSFGLRQKSLQKISKGFLMISLFQRRNMEISVVLPISRCLEKIYSTHASLLCRALRELQWRLSNCSITQCLTARVTLSKSLPIIKTSRFIPPGGYTNTPMHVHPASAGPLPLPLVLR